MKIKRGGNRMPKNRVKLYIGFGIYFILCILFITLPSWTSVIDRIEPHILGLPCSQFCILFAAVMICIGLIAFYIMEGKIEDADRAKREAEEEKQEHY